MYPAHDPAVDAIEQLLASVGVHRRDTTARRKTAAHIVAAVDKARQEGQDQ